MYGLSRAAQKDGTVHGLLNMVKSNKTRLREQKEANEALAPIVEGAHPIRLTLGTQAGAAATGVAVELLPESPVTTGVLAGMAFMTILIGGAMSRPELVGAGNGALAPHTYEATRAGVRSLRGWGAGKMPSWANNSDSSAVPAVSEAA